MQPTTEEYKRRRWTIVRNIEPGDLIYRRHGCGPDTWEEVISLEDDGTQMKIITTTERTLRKLRGAELLTIKGEKDG